MKYPEMPSNVTNEEQWNQVEFDIQKKYFSHIVYCRLSDDSSFEAMPSKNTLKWVEHHLENGYPVHDPAVYVGRYGSSKQIWAQIHAVSTISKNIMSERRDIGMTNGITIPIRDRFNQNRAWFTVGGFISEKEILELYLDPTIDDYFKKLHFSVSVHRIMKNTTFSEVESKILILSDYYNRLEDIADSTGTNSSYIKEIMVEAYRLKSMRNVEMW